MPDGISTLKEFWKHILKYVIKIFIVLLYEFQRYGLPRSFIKYLQEQKLDKLPHCA
ncbi:hypothetical protein [Helicobacter sp. UBA3407]|uniref:hypothetical protein n=1 Tax=Helicobacter TaxID=209 RepID=UPI002621F086|nr:hypothetical protein [Helicobacter sp. UBA3407]